jgi:putative FmdB family regulatory protein
MPTYEYACSACGHKFERFESITSKPNKTCMKCAKKKAERLISGGGGLLFKGTGFYITDYKKSATGAAAAGDSKSESKSETKTETKSETKAETKTESKPATDSKPKSSSKKS